MIHGLFLVYIAIYTQNIGDDDDIIIIVIKENCAVNRWKYLVSYSHTPSWCGQRQLYLLYQTKKNWRYYIMRHFIIFIK